MGYYTGVKFDVELHEEAIPLIENVHNPKSDGEEWRPVNRWEQAIDRLDEPEKIPYLDDIKRYSLLGRANFIPCGAISYVSRCPQMGDENYRELDGNRWKANCSLKNYNAEIEAFFALVFSNIVKEIYECLTIAEGYTSRGEPRYWTLEEIHQVEMGQRERHGKGEFFH